VQKEKGDPARGSELFVKQGCVTCHTLTRAEPPKGPFLGDVGNRLKRAEICESVLKPSAKIAKGYETQFFRLKDGDEIDGFIVKETDTEVEMRNVAGLPITVKKSDVKRRGTRNTSIMPEGLVGKLTVQEFAHVLAYLESMKGQAK
jgi:putative heme-binding domain-containing protein